MKSKEQWEQARLIGYITAQTQSTKKLKVTDIIKFPWEHSEPVVVTNSDIERLREKANQFKNILHGK